MNHIKIATTSIVRYYMNHSHRLGLIVIQYQVPKLLAVMVS